MKKEIRKIAKELELKVTNIEEYENKNMYYQKNYKVSIEGMEEEAEIICNAYNKDEFKKNNYEKEIREELEFRKKHYMN